MKIKNEPGVVVYGFYPSTYSWGRAGGGDLYEIVASLVYIVSLTPAKATS